MGWKSSLGAEHTTLIALFESFLLDESYAFFDVKTNRYILGPAIKSVNESTQENDTQNPTTEQIHSARLGFCTTTSQWRLQAHVVVMLVTDFFYFRIFTLNFLLFSYHFDFAALRSLKVLFHFSPNESSQSFFEMGKSFSLLNILITPSKMDLKSGLSQFLGTNPKQLS